MARKYPLSKKAKAKVNWYESKMLEMSIKILLAKTEKDAEPYVIVHKQIKALRDKVIEDDFAEQVAEAALFEQPPQSV